MKKCNIKKFLAGISALCVMTQALPVISSADTVTLYGDANLDGEVTLSDAVLIMQALSNPDVYSLSEQGADNADVYNRGDGISTTDALSIQKLGISLLDSLPESWQNGEIPSTDVTKIQMNNDLITVEGDYVEIEGTTITITHSGTFYIDGILNDGQININIPDETADPEPVNIFLDGVYIVGKSAPAILVTNAEKTLINLVDSTANFLSDGDTAYSGDNLGSAVIEAKDDLTINGGTGVLNITANTQDGIVCNNDIKINGGMVNINTLNATDKTDALKGKKSVTVKGGTLNIEAEGDGLKSSKGNVSVQGGLLNIKASNDAIQAETTIDISGGTVIAGGDRGLTSVTGTNITGGTVVATATDNQTDTALMSGTTQGTMLLNCIASGETDGCWKKANNLTVGNVKAYKWQKKYAYVLISDSSITADGSYKLTNNSTNATVTHDGTEDFRMSGTVTVFDNVNPAGTEGSTPAVPDTASSYTVTLSANSIKTDAPADVASVENNVLTIRKPAVMSISGENKGGQIVVDVDKTTYPDGVVELDLNGMNLTNESVAPIYVASIGDEVQIVAKSGTDNIISDGTSHTDSYNDSDGNINEINGAVFSRDDLKIKGSGNLTVNGNTADGIVSKNDLKIYNGNVTVNAVNDGVRGKDSVTIGNDTATDYSTLKLTVSTKSGDGIKSSSTETGTKAYGVVTINGGTVDIKSYADGIQAEQDFVMNGGDLNIYTYQGSAYTGSGSTSSGGNTGWGGGFGGGMQDGNSNKTDISAKGIKSVGIYDTAGTTWQSGGNITVNGGNITVDSSDDSLHCGGQININGGTFRLSSADDALHSDHDLILGKEGGTYSDFNIYVPKCYEGVEGNNIYQHSGTVVVKSDDDGYNAAGGADGSGAGNNTGWNQGGRPGGMGGGMGGSSGNILEITGGIAIVQSASGDHDAFDSNGNLTVSGGAVIANGNEPLDCDGTKSVSGGTAVTVSQGTSVPAGTQFTVADSSGNVIVSFTTMQGMGSPSFASGSGLTCYTGGTISGGTDLILSDDSQQVYGNGTISGGTTVTAGTSSSGNSGWGGRW